MLRPLVLLGLLLASSSAFAAAPTSARAAFHQPTHSATLRGGHTFAPCKSIPMLLMAWSVRYGQPREQGEITF